MPLCTTWFLTLLTVSRQPNRANGGADKAWIRFSEKSRGRSRISGSRCTGRAADADPLEARRSLLIGRRRVRISPPRRPTAVSTSPTGRLCVSVRLRLFLASFLMLFLELSLIRWTGAEIVHLSYFSNFVLLGSFLGIGLGFLRAGTSRPSAAALLAGRAARADRVRLGLPGDRRPSQHARSSSSPAWHVGPADLGDAADRLPRRSPRSWPVRASSSPTASRSCRGSTPTARPARLARRHRRLHAVLVHRACRRWCGSRSSRCCSSSCSGPQRCR